MRITVDDAACVGHGRCYALAPDVFASDDFGHCTVLVPEIEAGSPLELGARQGAENCPERAITITD